MDHCYVAQDEVYSGCKSFLDHVSAKWSLIVFEDEEGDLAEDLAVNFVYKTIVLDAQSFKIIARRTIFNGGDGQSKILMTYSPGGVDMMGSGLFQSIK